MTAVIRLLLPLVFVGGAAAAALTLRKHWNGFHGDKMRQKVALQVWEGEGGRLKPTATTSPLS
jgi:hypothetical protein